MRDPGHPPDTAAVSRQPRYCRRVKACSGRPSYHYRELGKGHMGPHLCSFCGWGRAWLRPTERPLAGRSAVI
jgi:hypothetical protein